MHNSKPTVSVVIPAYNAAKYIREAIESALNQTYPVHEIIVVDDGSTDRTAEIVKSMLVKYIYQDNKGPAAARNRGIREAKGDYIAFLDSDDMWLLEKIEKQMAKFKEDESCSMIHAGRIRIGLNGALQPAKVYHVPEGFVFEGLLRENFICSSSALVKKSCIDDAGLFDEDKRVYKSEDYDLWLRIAKIHKIGFIDMPLVKYRVNPFGHNRSNIAESYEAQKFVFLKALQWYGGDKEKLKKERLHRLTYLMGHSFFYVKQYSDAYSAFSQSVKIDRSDLKSIGWSLLSKSAAALARIQ